MLTPLLLLVLTTSAQSQMPRRVSKLQEVFAWKQITFNIGGNLVIQDRFAEIEDTRQKRQADAVFFNDDDDKQTSWNRMIQDRFAEIEDTRQKRQADAVFFNDDDDKQTSWNRNESKSFFTQYNNLPMGVERVGDRVFITLPRRRYGIPSTLNYLDLNQDRGRSPALRPYPDIWQGRSLTSVYRTRADECGRLWMVDTGLLEIPNNPQQVHPPSIVAYDLATNRQILRYPFKSSDIPAANTPTGLASITIDIVSGDCGGAYAYIPDLTTYGLIVYSLRDNDSWRLTHNYFSFNPTAGNLNIARQRFQWSDGIFSVTLTPPARDRCRTAYFHPMVSTTEFSVSTCVLRNKTASADNNFWTQFSVVGERGADSQSTMHGYHPGTSVMFFADIGRDAVSCWNTGTALSPTQVQILARDNLRLSYPSDLHVSGDEVWVMANSLPTWAYSTLDTNEYNFYVYKANVHDLISGTVCTGRSYNFARMKGQTDDEPLQEDS